MDLMVEPVAVLMFLIVAFLSVWLWDEIKKARKATTLFLALKDAYKDLQFQRDALMMIRNRQNCTVSEGDLDKGIAHLHQAMYKVGVALNEREELK
jgi:hypothetical protein